ncbi:methionine adenosyltransferase [Papillibacter cinnamivorans]|uniref:S-adenosylmethionine synthase n=1 Tax=Papillibacter cinnamivorans DSM 12816 TaxID=1122930 RepID=A0A1W2BVH4_9FIRM|nr:methionine adenosyltransferase [Papillibacter cinnamivorans]SMC76947.1 methionine adenosyltransferase [Papillibacter cinnamivorans DSM 12816]
MSNRVFTSESVTEGHPDKLCDQISDAVLDAILAQDKNARVACETIATTGMALVMGEISTNCYVDIPHIVRNTMKNIGYTNPAYGFDCNSCAVLTAIDEQSPDIALGVDKSFEYKESGTDEADLIGAGDQGMMFGFACDETPELMPAPISMAHQLSAKLAAVRKSGELPWLRPDGKSQVSVEYGDDGQILRCGTVVVSAQHDPDVSLKDLREAIVELVIRPVIPEKYLDKKTQIFVNPTGRFVVGGPVGDSGLTGRKIIVDTYGGYAAHGGGCFSGKDPTKVDRSAAYMARHVAKNIVAAGLARRCDIQVAYAIGVAHPVSVMIDTKGTGLLPDEKIAEIVNRCFDLRPAKIISYLDLRRPIYLQTAAYGHFGRPELNLPWESTHRAEELRSYLK